MLSIIVCSRNKTLLTEFIENVNKTVGVAYEIIDIDNSKNNHSIFSAYNLGFSKCNYPYICFVHEDVLFHTLNWGEKIIAHLQEPNTGILGLAGSDLVTRIPGSCSGKTSCVNIIQSDKRGKKASRKNLYPENFNQSKHSTILLDGVLLCLRRGLMEKLEFDEQIGGFHGYDFDIALQSTIAGYTNYVIYDIELEHFSRGQFDGMYIRNLIAVFKKWEKHLPLIGQSITDEKYNEINKLEEKRLLKLMKKMIKYGFPTTEIIRDITYYSEIIQSPKLTRKLKTIQFSIIFKRLLYCPQNLFK